MTDIYSVTAGFLLLADSLLHSPVCECFTKNQKRKNLIDAFRLYLAYNTHDDINVTEHQKCVLWSTWLVVPEPVDVVISFNPFAFLF